MSVDYIADAGRKAKGQRPFFLESVQTEQLLNITMALAQELAVTRERLDTIERLLEAGNGVTREAVENYKPDPVAADQRQIWHQEFISRILRIVQQSREEITEKSNGQADMETVVSQISQ